MLNQLFSLARPALFAVGPEEAHELTLRSLEMGIYPRCSSPADPRLAVNVWGLSIPNPVGIAAGFDKDARVPDAILNMGFGYAEIGTTTPLPQPGNPKPRAVRLVADRAVINRLGFNNEGHAAALARLSARRRVGIVGVNIGANKDSADRPGDYVKGLDAFYSVASYFTVNISSPNTPGLRDLQSPEALDPLLARIMEARARHVAAGEPSRPIVVKIAPDIAEGDIDAVCQALIRHNVDGIAVSNTTLSRHGLSSPEANEAGGLSGRPLFHRATVMLARVYSVTGGRIPLIGIGGIDSPAAALSKIEAGATLLQLYTGLIYEGPGLIRAITSHLEDAVRRKGLSSITQLTGSKSSEWAEKPIEA